MFDLSPARRLSAGKIQKHQGPILAEFELNFFLNEILPTYYVRESLSWLLDTRKIYRYFQYRSKLSIDMTGLVILNNDI